MMQQLQQGQIYIDNLPPFMRQDRKFGLTDGGAFSMLPLPCYYGRLQPRTDMMFDKTQRISRI
jgi:hypothetical protein